MLRLPAHERPHWRDIMLDIGLKYGRGTWRESVAYRFTLREVEDDIEASTNELMRLAYAAVDWLAARPEEIARFGYPEAAASMIAESWRRRDRDLVCRFDLTYHHGQPPKLLEINGDTPTTLYEASIFQWLWFEELRDHGKAPGQMLDQFNSLHEKLLDALRIFAKDQTPAHFTSLVIPDTDDEFTVRYLMDVAGQAGMKVKFTPVPAIAVDAQGRFLDQDDIVIRRLFKLYPWEDMLLEEFGKYLPASGVAWCEPAWKLLLSNKAILPVLWRLNPGHPNLLPAYHAGEADSVLVTDHRPYVMKPLHGRAGVGVAIIGADNRVEEEGPAGRYGDEGNVVQAYAELPSFGPPEDRVWAVIGSWTVAGRAAGMGIRESTSRITWEMSSFVPHFIAD